MGLWLVFGFDLQGDWLFCVIECVLDVCVCMLVMILCGYVYCIGMFGFVWDDVCGDVWFEVVCENEFGLFVWNQIVIVFEYENWCFVDVFVICKFGYEVGGDLCGYLFGCFYKDGMYVEFDLYCVVYYFCELMEVGGNMVVYWFGYMYYYIGQISMDCVECVCMQVEVVEVVCKVYEMGYMDGFECMLMFIGDIEDYLLCYCYVDELC